MHYSLITNFHQTVMVRLTPTKVKFECTTFSGKIFVLNGSNFEQ